MILQLKGSSLKDHHTKKGYTGASVKLGTTHKVLINVDVRVIVERRFMSR